MFPDICSFSLITDGDALVSSHTHYGGLAVNGLLTDGTPTQSATIGQSSWAQALQTPHLFTFQGGITLGQGIPFDWAEFERLAMVIDPGEDAQGGHVFVVNQGRAGGTFSLDHFVPPGTHAGVWGGFRILIIFMDEGPVTLTATRDGRQFAASVLAPWCTIVVDSQVGYIDGTIIAKSFRGEMASSSVQLHGRCYTSPFTCNSERKYMSSALSPSSSSSAGSTGCADAPGKWERKCTRKAAKGKCRKARIRRNCQASCGQCVG